MAGTVSIAPTTLSAYLDSDNVQRLQEMGYTFGAFLGGGGYGAAFRCEFATTDEQGNPNVRQQAAKLVKIKYTPDLRFITERERRKLSSLKKIKLKYRIKGKMKRENVQWRKAGPSNLPEDMVENPLHAEQERQLRRQVQNIETELQAMQKANHINVVKLDNIIRFYDEYAENPYMATVVLFMELAQTDLNAYLRAIPHTEDEAKVMVAQIGLGIAHLHSRGVAHMDLKTENILIFRDAQQNLLLKITDFGLSVLYDPNETPVGSQMRGTRLYCCPALMQQFAELRSGVRNEMSYDPTKCDIWALAVIILVIVYGKPSIKTVFTVTTTMGGSKRDAYITYLSTEQHSQQLEHLLKQMFVEDQDGRYNIDQVCEDEWLRDTIAEQVRLGTTAPPYV